jgi:hypothetical protein
MLTTKSFSIHLAKSNLTARSAFQNDEDIEDSGASRTIHDAIENVIDAREWDVPYHIRVAIDKGN